MAIILEITQGSTEILGEAEWRKQCHKLQLNFADPDSIESQLFAFSPT